MKTTTEYIPVSDNELLNALQWRYATKTFDPNRSLAPETLDALLQALRLSPSSMGLQPYLFIRVADTALRMQLLGYSNNQKQVTDAAELIVFAAKNTLSEDEVRSFVQLSGELRGHTPEAMDNRTASVMRFLGNFTPDALLEWSARQAYIAMGQLLTSAAMLGVDACPMEGIKKAEYDRLLVTERYNSKVLAAVALGYRSENDHTALYPKARRPLNELVITI